MKSIRAQLIGGLSLIILFFIAQAAFVWWDQESTRKDVVDATRKNTIASSQLGELAVLAQQVRRYEKEYFVYVSNEEKRNGYVKEWTGASDKLNQILGTMRGNQAGAFTSADQALIEQWMQAASFYGTQMRLIFDAVNVRKEKMDLQANELAAINTAVAAKAKAKTATPAAPAVEVITMLTPIQANDMIQLGKTRFSDVLIKGVSEMTKAKTKATLSLSEIAGTGFDKLLYVVLATVVAGILIALGLMLKLPRTVSQPLAKLTTSVDNISRGNLEGEVKSGGIQEFEGLATALERLRLSQKSLVALMQR
jgi:HAMP domain-containing protein